jgi:hypothetical protein
MGRKENWGLHKQVRNQAFSDALLVVGLFLKRQAFAEECL